MSLPCSLPSGGHGLWVLSFITASLKPRARASTARSCSPHLPSPLLLPFSNRVAFSSFICLLGWYVIRAGVLMGNTKWSFRGAAFGSQSSQGCSCPCHWLCLLPWAWQPHTNRKSLWDAHSPSCFKEISQYLCQYRLISPPPCPGDPGLVFLWHHRGLSPLHWLWKGGTSAVVRTPTLKQNNKCFNSSISTASTAQRLKKNPILH